MNKLIYSWWTTLSRKVWGQEIVNVITYNQPGVALDGDCQASAPDVQRLPGGGMDICDQCAAGGPHLEPLRSHFPLAVQEAIYRTPMNLSHPHQPNMATASVVHHGHPLWV